MARTLRLWPLLSVALALFGGSQTNAQERASLGAPVTAVDRKVLETDKAKQSIPAESTPIEDAKATADADPYAGSWLTWPKMTGDWHGARTALEKDCGISFDTSITQFYQGVTSGGREQDWRYGGKLDYLLNLDGEKIGLWKGLFINLHGETRYGQDTNNIDGMFSASNFAMLFPKANEQVTGLTAIKITQALSEDFVAFGGKLNLIDGNVLGFSGGDGTQRFMNGSLAFNPILNRVPFSTWGAGFAVLKDQEPVFTFMALDTVDRATTFKLNRAYEEGVLLFAEARLPVKPMGLPGHQIIGGMWSSAEYTAVDRSSFVLIPGEGVVAPIVQGTWALYYHFDQFLWVDSANPKRGWGAFGMFGIGDGNPNPLQSFASIGLGGSSLIPGRDNDTFGAGYYRIGLSGDFKNLLGGPILGPSLGQRDEQGMELFYNMAISPWCHLTGDLQMVEPSTRVFNTAIVAGLRLKLDF